MDELAWTIDFNDIIRALYWLSAAVAVFSLLLVLQVMWMRRLGQMHRRRADAVRKAWSPVLASPERHTGVLPRVHSKDALTFLMMWNAAQQRDGASRTELNAIAKRLEMDATVLKLMHKRDVATRLVAIDALGYLGELSAAPSLRDFVDSPNAVLSFAAARALLKIDRKFARTFVALMIRRSDWSPVRLQALVQEEGDSLSAPITTLVRGSAAISRDLIQYLRFFDPMLTRPVVCRVLAISDDPVALTAGLKVLADIGTSSEASLAARFTEHEDWRVRVQAANALGRLGDAAQLDAVIPLLSDSHWWVRFRAAQAVAALQTGGERQLQSILDDVKDRFGRDMLAQIIAERKPAFHNIGAP